MGTAAQLRPARLQPSTDPLPCPLQSIAGELPSISGALNSLKLPTIPLVNFNLNTLTQPVADAAENLQGLLDDGAPACARCTGACLARRAMLPSLPAATCCAGTHTLSPARRPPPRPAVCNTTLLLVRENRVWPIYVAAKTFVCCDLTNSLYNVWVAWVVAGSLTFALCLLASLRVVTATLRPTGRSDYSSHDGAAAKAAAADGGGGAAATNTEPA